MRVEEIAYRVRGRFPAAFARLQKLIEVALHLGLRRARSRAASDSRVEFVANGQRACLRMLGVADADLLVALMESASEHELEFLIEKNGEVIPIEVKAGNTSTVTLNRFIEKYSPSCSYKFINGNIGISGTKYSLPHYMVMFL